MGKTPLQHQRENSHKKSSASMQAPSSLNKTTATKSRFEYFTDENT